LIGGVFAAPDGRLIDDIRRAAAWRCECIPSPVAIGKRLSPDNRTGVSRLREQRAESFPAAVNQ